MITNHRPPWSGNLLHHVLAPREIFRRPFAPHFTRLLGNFARESRRYHFELRSRRVSVFEMVAKTAGLLVRLEAVRVVTDVIAAFLLHGVLGVLGGCDRRVAVISHDRFERTRERITEMRRRYLQMVLEAVQCLPRFSATSQGTPVWPIVWGFSAVAMYIPAMFQ